MVLVLLLAGVLSAAAPEKAFRSDVPIGAIELTTLSVDEDMQFKWTGPQPRLRRRPDTRAELLPNIVDQLELVLLGQTRAAVKVYATAKGGWYLLGAHESRGWYGAGPGDPFIELEELIRGSGMSQSLNDHWDRRFCPAPGAPKCLFWPDARAPIAAAEIHKGPGVDIVAYEKPGGNPAARIPRAGPFAACKVLRSLTRKVDFSEPLPAPPIPIFEDKGAWLRTELASFPPYEGKTAWVKRSDMASVSPLSGWKAQSAARKELYPVANLPGESARLLRIEWVGGMPWAEVEILSGSPIYQDDVTTAATGWIPVFGPDGKPWLEAQGHY